MKTFVFSELMNEKENSFEKLFNSIDEIIRNSNPVLTRDTVTSIFIDVAREITEFNNDLNQVSQKLTLLFAGYVHLYALYMSWKKFSEIGMIEANKPYNDLKAQREEKLKYFIQETSDSDVKQSDGQTDRFLGEVLTYLKSLIETEKN